MAPSRAPSASLLRSLKALTLEAPVSRRAISSTQPSRAAAQAAATTASFDPETASSYTEEHALMKAGTPPVGSRRRRVARQQTSNIPFEALPYQCFQEARQILIADREQKLQQIANETAKLQRLRAMDASQVAGGETGKALKMKSMETHIAKLKIYADSNDPNVKRRFEDGMGDYSKPIYRFLAERKWKQYRRKVQLQRVETMKVVPDVVPDLSLEVDIKMSFNNRGVSPGDFVDSARSENAPQLSIQSFTAGERLVTIAFIDPDVPNVETDLFESRCHFLATNIPISATSPQINLANLPEEQVIFPWLPPHALKGAPYHRLSLVVLEHKNNIPAAKSDFEKYTRESFTIRSELRRRSLRTIGAALFRTKWDDNMADLLTRHGLEGANIELKRKKVEPLPYKRRNPSSFR